MKRPIEIGKFIGCYHKLDKLGEASMTVVLKTFDRLVERDVAIKLIRIERTTQEMMATK